MFVKITVQDIILSFRILTGYVISMKYGHLRLTSKLNIVDDYRFIEFYEQNQQRITDLEYLFPTPIAQSLNAISYTKLLDDTLIAKFDNNVKIHEQQWTHLNIIRPMDKQEYTEYVYEWALTNAKKYSTLDVLTGNYQRTLVEIDTHTENQVMVTKKVQRKIRSPFPLLPMPDGALSFVIDFGCNKYGTPEQPEEYIYRYRYKVTSANVIKWLTSK